RPRCTSACAWAAVRPAVRAATATAVAAGREPLALFFRVPSPLFAGRLDLLEVEVIVGPLHRDLLADELLDSLVQERTRFVGEADRRAGRAGARSPTDTVDVVLRVLRQVPVDDVAHALDV